MGILKYFAYLLILSGIALEFFTFSLCRKSACYFFDDCLGNFKLECIAVFFVASLLLIVSGALILKRQKDKRYV